MKREASLDLLTQGTRLKVEELLQDIEDSKLPFVVFETYRSQERQDYLYAKGRTTQGPRVTWAKKSKHTKRTAVDFILDSDRLQGVHLELYAEHGAWYTGTRAKRSFLECGDILGAWLVFGALAEQNGLVWGGRWKKRPTDLIGWDPYHVQG